MIDVEPQTGRGTQHAVRSTQQQFVPGSQTPAAISTEIALEIHHALIPGELAWYTVEGAHGTVEMQLDCDDVEQMRYGDALALLLKTIRELQHAGARLIVAEYPDSEELVTYARLLREAGFEIEATVPDAIADGIGLHFAVKRLAQRNRAEFAVAAPQRHVTALAVPEILPPVRHVTE